jgi:hypothetical protein
MEKALLRGSNLPSDNVLVKRRVHYVDFYQRLLRKWTACILLRIYHQNSESDVLSTHYILYYSILFLYLRKCPMTIDTHNMSLFCVSRSQSRSCFCGILFHLVPRTRILLLPELKLLFTVDKIAIFPVIEVHLIFTIFAIFKSRLVLVRHYR